MSSSISHTLKLPNFDAFDANACASKTLEAIKHAEQGLELLLQEKLSAQDFIEKQEALSQQIAKAFSPLSHLNNVLGTPELRSAYEHVMPELVAYNTRLGQHAKLYATVKALHAQCTQKDTDSALFRLLTLDLQDFTLQGVQLEASKKQRIATLKQTLNQQHTQFQNNVVDASLAWHYHSNTPIEGIPEHAHNTARANAKSKQQDGYLYGLDAPTYIQIMAHCSDRALRERFYHAYVTRASDQAAENAGQWDNSDCIETIMNARHQLAQTLGFEHYAAYSFERKMAQSAEAVEEFLLDLYEQSKTKAVAEYTKLTDFATRTLGLDSMKSWDQAYVMEHYTKKTLAFDQEMTRPYFALDAVLKAMFDLCTRLFDVRFKRCSERVSVWHKDVVFYTVHNAQGAIISGFYLDLYARPYKRPGAWFDDAQSRCISRLQHDLPVAYLTCNFAQAAEGKTAMLTHQEATTLFHEFGHGLHHMLTRIDYASVSGISGVLWDAVELPSQLLENWLWQPEFLHSFARHNLTQTPMPETMVQALCQSRTLLSGIAMLRQLEFSLFDLRLHRNWDPQEGISQVQATLDAIRALSPLPAPPSYNRFQHSFSHIFAGGYACGYYSYKWAEVLSSDAFSLFEEQGLWCQKAGKRFADCILTQGGAVDPERAYTAFRGRPASNQALLRHAGMLESNPM